MPSARGISNNARQAFIYRGIQVIPSLESGWIAMIGGRLYVETAEDEMCCAIDLTHIMIEAAQHRSAFPAMGCASLTSAISGAQPQRKGRRASPSRRSEPAHERRYSTSHKRGAA